MPHTDVKPSLQYPDTKKNQQIKTADFRVTTRHKRMYNILRPVCEQLVNGTACVLVQYSTVQYWYSNVFY